MLKIQSFLRSGGTFETLKEKYGVNNKVSDDKKLVIFNYDQIDSPKYVELVEECRGLVLENNTWNVVAKAMTRFYNYGERKSFDGTFKIEKSKILEKLDGSLILLYYYDGSWRVNTRNSFGDGQVNSLTNLSWRELFLSTINQEKLQDLDVTYTYVFELCSIYNKVVVHHIEPKSYILTIINNITVEELDNEQISRYASLLECGLPLSFNFTDIDSLVKYLGTQKGHTFEGVVAKYKHHRLKFKNPLYVALHQLKGNNGDCITSVKHIVPILIANEVDEVCAVFPEYEPMLRKFEKEYLEAKQEIVDIWDKVKDIKDQKLFAQQVVASKWSAILFLAKKSGKNPIVHLSEAEDLLIKKFKG